jgi:hypothetical protein
MTSGFGNTGAGDESVSSTTVSEIASRIVARFASVGLRCCLYPVNPARKIAAEVSYAVRLEGGAA